MSKSKEDKVLLMEWLANKNNSQLSEILFADDDYTTRDLASEKGIHTLLYPY